MVLRVSAGILKIFGSKQQEKPSSDGIINKIAVGVLKGIGVVVCGALGGFASQKIGEMKGSCVEERIVYGYIAAFFGICVGAVLGYKMLRLGPGAMSKTFGSKQQEKTSSAGIINKIAVGVLKGIGVVVGGALGGFVELVALRKVKIIPDALLGFAPFLGICVGAVLGYKLVTRIHNN